ncbi:MAG: preprotein translocase subunit YajC [Deltaproteobacteria bacterium]|nr:preprotein translocase subunit YajC [Deltaproteobacteria bacterium]
MGTGGEAGGQAGGMGAFVPLILMFVIFYFLLIRPQQKKQKLQREMIGSLKKGDRVITTGVRLFVLTLPAKPTPKR